MSTTDGAVVGPDPITLDQPGHPMSGLGRATGGPTVPDVPGDVDGTGLLDEAGRDDGPDATEAEITDARTVTEAAGAVLAATAPAPARTWTVSDVVEPPGLPGPLADGSRGSRLAVAATALVVVGVLGGLGWLVWAAWDYVTTAPQASQQADWEKLRGLIDLVVAVVLLVVGTVLGATLQARWTTSARAQAREHARAAAAQHEVARSNAEAARRNAAAAMTAGTDLARALDLIDEARPLLAELQELVAGRDRAGTRFVTAHVVASATREPHLAGYRLDRGGDLRLAEAADEGVDRRLTTLAVRAEVLSGQIGDWLLRRR